MLSATCFHEHVERIDLPGLTRPGRGVQPTRGVGSSEIDERLDELRVEEQIAEQLAMRRAVAADL